MNNKSIIQEILEKMERSNSNKLNLSSSINNLMDKYNIEDSIFTLKNNMLYEITEGYMSIDEEYDNLDEAIKNYDNSPNSAIRVIRNNRFQIGHYYRYINECHNSYDNILDINKLELLG